MPKTAKRLARDAKIKEKIAVNAAIDFQHGKSPGYRWKIGNEGDRVGWNKSISAELGSRQSPEERIWRQKVLFRDGFKCVCCDSTENLEVDHIKPRSLYPEFKFNLDNGQTLCHKHHVETATYGSKVHKLLSIDAEQI